MRTRSSSGRHALTAVAALVGATFLASPDIAAALTTQQGQARAAASSTTGSAAKAAADDLDLRMPSTVPSNATPWVEAGKVQKIVQIGNTMVVGGSFSTVSSPSGGTSYTRTNTFAFNATTGAVSTNFVPQLNGIVETLLPGPTAGTVYVGGDFTTVNGAAASHLVLLNVTTGQAVPTFHAPTTNGSVEALARDGDRLYVGGFFRRAGGVDRGGLASLDATTGALDPFMDVSVSGHHNDSGSGAQGSVGPREMVLTPDGTRLAVIGNFKTVDGLARDQLVMVSLDGTSAEVTPDWATTRYTPYCFNNAFDSYMRGIAISPDGTWFVVTATGGHNDGTLCDTASRWEFDSSGTSLEPTWSADAGGDTLWGVGISDAAVYIGGHSRWMNNPFGSDSAGQGAVPRPGLAALDPQTGVPLKWNPGRNPRGEAAYAFLPTDDGLWLTSNTEWIGNRQYLRKRIAFFPYAGGSTLGATNTGALPGNVVIGGSSAGSNVLYRVNAGGPTVLSNDSGPDWSGDADDSNPLRNSGSNAAGWSPITAVTAAVPAGTPTDIFNSERWDPDDGDEMQWHFPVDAGDGVEVRLYFANRCDCTDAVGSRTFNVSIDGQPKLTNYDIVADVGTQRGTMKAFDIMSDGSVDIAFGHVTENPLINGIEIVGAGAPPSTSETAQSVAFDGSDVTSSQQLTTAGLDWTKVRGAVMIDDTLFYFTTGGLLHTRTFDGSTFGSNVNVDPYHDPKWANVDTGSGQTYDGQVPDWYGQLGSVSGMFYDEGRLYYTLAGDSTLYWRSFVPDSGIVSPETHSTDGSFDWSDARGMFLDGNRLYVVSAVDGSLRRISFANNTPTGPGTVVNSPDSGGIDWRGRALFLSTIGDEGPNELPTAAFSRSCVAIKCRFDGSASDDRDGLITAYDWDFGDGDTASGVTPTHVYSDGGSFNVTLTVTDNDGAQVSTMKTVAVTHAVSYVGSRSTRAVNANPGVLVPAAVSSGDRLVLALTLNKGATAIHQPTGVAGWTKLGTTRAKSMKTVVWTKVAGPATGGKRVHIPLAGRAKFTLAVSAYAGVDTTAKPAFRSAAHPSKAKARTSPTIAATAGSWVVSYWADKSDATTRWTAGLRATSRQHRCGAGPDHICSLLTDSAKAVPAGRYSGVIARTNKPSSLATAWSVVLRPAS